MTMRRDNNLTPTKDEEQVITRPGCAKGIVRVEKTVNGGKGEERIYVSILSVRSFYEKLGTEGLSELRPGLRGAARVLLPGWTTPTRSLKR